jgi:hypothetical protein
MGVPDRDVLAAATAAGRSWINSPQEKDAATE